MNNTDEEIFCLCFRCDKPIKVGDKVHSICYSYEKIESSVFIAPIYAEGLGTWCSDCFTEIVKKEKGELSIESLLPLINKDT
tara:strand:+ start:34744 stop:34989 length:246 start_codon:yes stop_codon:yes gene_type:complete